MAKLSITLGQMHIALADQKRNFATAEQYASAASQRKSHILILPELWSTGYCLNEAKEHASELNKGMFSQLSTLATQHKIAILGSILEKRGLEVANSAPLFAPSGRMMGIYRKIHLFRLMNEDQYLQPGSAPLVLDLPWGVTGLAICYDLRFPELFRKYVVDQNVRIIMIPAEWPLARLEHWRALLIARAIENQCYVVAVNACGETGGTMFGGHSMVVDPWGRIVVELGDQAQVVTVEVDLDLVDEVRKTIPVFEDMRHDIYG